MVVEVVLGVKWSAFVIARPMYSTSCELVSEIPESYHLECFTKSTLIVKISNSYFQPREQSYGIDLLNLGLVLFRARDPSGAYYGICPPALTKLANS